MKNEKFLVLGILFLACVVPLIIFNGAIDDFVPNLMSDILDISQKGYVPVEQQNSIPGYFVLGSILTIICGFSVRDLAFFPIQLFPFILVFFLFLYTFSKNYILSSLLTLIEIISGISGSSKVFFWPHGLGSILFYIAVIILYKLLNDKRKISEFRLLLIIIGSSLVFMSYDLCAVLLLFIGTLSFILFILHRYFNYSKSIKSEYHSSSLSIFNLLLIISVVEMSFSKFLYNNIIPTFVNTKYIEISSIDKIISFYIHKNYLKTPLNDLLINFPISVSILSSIKYLLLLIFILIFLFIIFKKVINKEILEFSSIGILSIIIVSGFYAFLRFYIGQVFVTYIYLPGILSSIYLYKFSPSLKRVIIFFILFILIICPINYYGISTHNLITKDENKCEVLKAPSYWCFDHQDSKEVASDVLTQGFLKYYPTEKKVELEKSTSSVDRNVQIFTTNDVLFIINRLNSSESHDIFVINYNLRTMSLNNWVVIKSWDVSKNVIENNCKLNKIYDLQSIAIFSKLS